MAWAIQSGNNRRDQYGLLIFAGLGMTGFMMLQDLLTARRMGSSFYWNESLLFSAYWLLAIPIFFITRQWVKRAKVQPTSADLAGISILAMLVHMVVYALGLWLVSMVFMDHTYGFQKNLYYTISSDLVKYLLMYAGLYFYLIPVGRSIQPPNSLLSPVSEPSNKLLVTQGKTSIPIPVSSISYIQTADPYIAIHADGKKHLHAQSLSGILDQLDSRFIRIHRSAIVNTQSVIKWTSRGNGDYDVLLSDGVLLRLSRNYAQAFWEAMEKPHSA
ncbi:MAG: LytTR family DNA-binding domain-containing protein [Chitinophagaceae bacterium]